MIWCHSISTQFLVKQNVTQLYLSMNVSFTTCIGFGLLQVSLGYFMADLAMMFWFYPSLGGLEYVSSFCLDICFLSFPPHACSFITDEEQYDPLLRYVWYHHSSILYIFFGSLIDPDCNIMSLLKDSGSYMQLHFAYCRQPPNYELITIKGLTINK